VPLPGPETAGEVGRAGLYAMLGGGILKLFELTLSAFDKKRGVMTAEAQTAAALREELRKDNEYLREREDSLEVRLSAIDVDLHQTRARVMQLETENAALRQENADLKTEIRAWRRGLRSPNPTPILPGDP